MNCFKFIVLAVLFTSSAFAAVDYEDLCQIELGLYNDCEFNFVRANDTEIISGCGVTLSKRCQHFFSDPYRFAPSCYFAHKDAPLHALKNIKSRKLIYNNICARAKNEVCKYHLKNDVKKSLIASKNEYIKIINPKTLFPEFSTDYYNYTVTAYDCQKRSSPVQIEINEKYVLSKYSISSSYEKSVSDCLYELAEYDDCEFDILLDSQQELDQKCAVFKTDKCKQFIQNPYNYVPSCYLENTKPTFMNALNYYNTRVTALTDVCKLLLQRKCTFTSKYQNSDGLLTNITHEYTDDYQYNSKCVIDQSKVNAARITYPLFTYTITTTGTSSPTPKVDLCSPNIVNQGYNCCSTCADVGLADSNGLWGLENNVWCAVPYKCNYNSNSITKVVYNSRYDRCLYAPENKGDRITLKNCDKSVNTKWLVPASGKGIIQSQAYPDLCITTDINDYIVLDDCSKAKQYEVSSELIKATGSQYLCSLANSERSLRFTLPQSCSNYSYTIAGYD